MTDYSYLNDIKKYGIENKIPILLDDTLEYIIKIIKMVNPDRILEIGSAIGYSAICFSKYINDSARIDTIEIEPIRVMQAICNIQKMKLDSKIRVIEGDALEILPYLNEKYDIIFIDAAKGKYVEFFEHALRLVKKNGYIIADNVLYKGMVQGKYNKHKQRTAVNKLREFIDKVLENKDIESKLINIGDGLTVSKKIM